LKYWNIKIEEIFKINKIRSPWKYRTEFCDWETWLWPCLPTGALLEGHKTGEGCSECYQRDPDKIREVVDVQYVSKLQADLMSSRVVYEYLSSKKAHWF